LIDERVTTDLERMQRAAAKAIAFTSGISREAFLADEKTQAAVMMTLIVIGEAATRIAAAAPDWMASHPELPWNEMRGLRNRGAHDYEALDFAAVWVAVRRSVPELLQALEALADEGPDHSAS
jgi:uncharacterized protein with HEPN domain